LGQSVAISGRTAIVGAPYFTAPNGSEGGRGRAFIYQQTDAGEWVLADSFAHDDETTTATVWSATDSDRFGSSVAIDGDTAVVGAPCYDIGSNTTCDGAVYVYERDASGSWSFKTRLETGSWDMFGLSVSVSGDRIAVGAPDYDVRTTDGASTTLTNMGAAYIYARDANDAWNQTKKIMVFQNDDWVPPSFGNFGYSVSISGDTFVIGAPRYRPTVDGAGVADAGAAYVYEYKTNQSGVLAWQQTARLENPTTPWQYDYFGASVSTDGQTVVVGCPACDYDATGNYYRGDSGLAFVWERKGDQTWPTAANQTLPATPAGWSDRLGQSVSVRDNVLVVGVPQSGNGRQGIGKALVYKKDSEWTLYKELTPGDADSADGSGDGFGSAVATSGTQLIVGAPYADTYDTNYGAAYLYGFGQCYAQGPESGSCTCGFGSSNDESGNCVSSESIIPAGSFQRAGATVTITRSMAMMKTEVTQGLWKEISGGVNPSYFPNCDGAGGDSCPVEKVNWFSAAGFANALTAAKNAADGTSLTPCYTITGCSSDDWRDGSASGCTVSFADTSDPLSCTGYRLPTEAEWEYAYRAGTTTVYYNGDSEAGLEDIAWYSANSSNTTHPVSQKDPNAWGLYDMSGNVSEWTWDRSGDYPGVIIDYTGPQEGDNRVLRGGSWGDSAGGVAAAHRNIYFPPDNRNLNYGFRLTRTLP
jgi:formylglycine-generating enzyme required for sulfatase activity